MKITLIRKDEEQGTEALSLCDTDAFFEKVKTENKAGHISELREILPRLAGSSARYVHIDKLPRVYPAVEYTRKQNWGNLLLAEYKKDVDAAVPLSDFKASYTLQRTMMTADTHVNRLYITHLLRIC